MKYPDNMFIRKNESTIRSFTPFIQLYHTFPLSSIYEKTCSDPLPELYGNAYDSRPPHAMKLYLTLRYGQLHLNWGLAEDGDKIHFYEFNTRFPYTGAFTTDLSAFSFENGQLVDTPHSVQTTNAASLCKEDSNLSDEFPTDLFCAFCSRLQRLEEDRRSFVNDLSAYMDCMSQLHNEGQISEEYDLEKLYQYAHLSHMMIQDEYETVTDVLTLIAFKWVQNTSSKEDASRLRQLIRDQEAKGNLCKKIQSTFTRPAMRSIIEFCSTYLPTNETNTQLPPQVKRDFYTLIHIFPDKIQPESVQTRCTHKSIRPYLDD